MPITNEQLDSVIQGAVARHQQNGKPAPSPQALKAVHAWASDNQERLNKAVTVRSFTPKILTDRLVAALGKAQESDVAQPIGAAQITAALNDGIGGCNC